MTRTKLYSVDSFAGMLSLSLCVCVRVCVSVYRMMAYSIFLYLRSVHIHSFDRQKEPGLSALSHINVTAKFHPNTNAHQAWSNSIQYDSEFFLLVFSFAPSFSPHFFVAPYENGKLHNMCKWSAAGVLFIIIIIHLNEMWIDARDVRATPWTWLCHKRCCPIKTTK